MRLCFWEVLKDRKRRKPLSKAGSHLEQVQTSSSGMGSQGVSTQSPGKEVELLGAVAHALQ